MSRVEIEIGKVLESSLGRARVEVAPGSLCAHCAAASTCIPASGGGRIIEVSDPIGIAPGLSVRIELAAERMLLASALAYMTPLAGLMAGAIVGFYSAVPSSAELWGGVGAVAGLAVGLALSRLLGERLARRGKLTPVIIGVVADQDKDEKENDD